VATRKDSAAKEIGQREKNAKMTTQVLFMIKLQVVRGAPFLPENIFANLFKPAIFASCLE
jgi:hypothetical protein